MSWRRRPAAALLEMAQTSRVGYVSWIQFRQNLSSGGTCQKECCGRLLEKKSLLYSVPAPGLAFVPVVAQICCFNLLNEKKMVFISLRSLLENKFSDSNFSVPET